MNKIIKINQTIVVLVLLGSAILFATNVFAFGHIDEKKLKQIAIPTFAFGLVALAKECQSDPSAYEDCSDLESLSYIIEVARYVVICSELPCEKTSIANFDKICSADADCNELLTDGMNVGIKVFEECFLDYECKTKLKACYANPTCWQACMNNPSEDNPACQELKKVYPDGFIDRIWEEWEQ